MKGDTIEDAQLVSCVSPSDVLNSTMLLESRNEKYPKHFLIRVC